MTMKLKCKVQHSNKFYANYVKAIFLVTFFKNSVLSDSFKSTTLFSVATFRQEPRVVGDVRGTEVHATWQASETHYSELHTIGSTPATYFISTVQHPQRVCHFLAVEWRVVVSAGSCEGLLSFLCAVVGCYGGDSGFRINAYRSTKEQTPLK